MKAMLQKTKIGNDMSQKVTSIPTTNHFRAVPSSKKPAIAPRRDSKQRQSLNSSSATRDATKQVIVSNNKSIYKPTLKKAEPVVPTKGKAPSSI